MYSSSVKNGILSFIYTQASPVYSGILNVVSTISSVDSIISSVSISSELITISVSSGIKGVTLGVTTFVVISSFG